jgi:hypothetical protein
MKQLIEKLQERSVSLRTVTVRVKVISQSSGKLDFEAGTTVTETTTATVATAAVTDAPPVVETEASLSPDYALESPVFPESVLGSPSKMHIKESMMTDTVKNALAEAAETLAVSADSDATVVGEEVIDSAGAVGGAELGAVGGPATLTTEPLNAEVTYAAIAVSKAISDSSDVSFHTMGDAAAVHSDLEVNETDEETAVFKTKKRRFKRFGNDW